MRKGVEIYQNVSEEMHSSIDVLIRRLSEFPFRPNSFRNYDQKLGKIANYLSSHKVYIGVSSVVMPKSFTLENIPESHKFDGLELSKKELESKINQNNSNFMLMRTVNGYFLVKSFDLNDSCHYVFFEPSGFDGEPKLKYVSVLINPEGYTKTRHMINYQTIRPIFEVKKEDFVKRKHLWESDEPKIFTMPRLLPSEVVEARFSNLILRLLENPSINSLNLTNKEFYTLEKMGTTFRDLKESLAREVSSYNSNIKTSRRSEESDEDVVNRIIEKIRSNAYLKSSDLTSHERYVLNINSLLFKEMKEDVRKERESELEKNSYVLSEEKNPFQSSGHEDISPRNKLSEGVWKKRFDEVVEIFKKNPSASVKDIGDIGRNTLQKFGHTISSIKDSLNLSNYKNVFPSNIYPPEIWEARLYNLIDKVVKRNRIRKREMTSKEISTLAHFSLHVSDIRKYLIENYPHLEFEKTEKNIHRERYENAQKMRQKLDIYLQKNPWRAHKFLPTYYKILIEKLYDGDIVKALTNQRLKIDLENYEITKLGKSLVETSRLFKEEDSQTLFLRRLESEKAIRLVNENLTVLGRNGIAKGYLKKRSSDLEKRIIEILSSNPSRTITRAELIGRNRSQLGYSDLEISGALRILKEDSKISIKDDRIKLNETAEMLKIDPFTAVLGVTNDLVASRKSFSSSTIQINLYKKFGFDLPVYRIEKYLDEIGKVIGFEKVGVERLHVKQSVVKYPKSILKPMEPHAS